MLKRIEHHPLSIDASTAFRFLRQGRRLARVALLVCAPLASGAAFSSLPDGRDVMHAVADRDVGETRISDMTLTLTNRRGNTRTQETVTYRKYYGEERRAVIFYTAPSNVRGTAFLTYDYPDPDVDDDQWLYLPAMRSVRRISASNRGDYFLGTDLTYEDIKNENRLPVTDYQFETLGRETVDEVDSLLINAVPVSQDLAEELGYGRIKTWVDPEIHVIRKAEFFDVAGNPLKTLHAHDIRDINGIWTVHRMTVENHKTGHTTTLHFSNVRYNEEVDDSMFRQDALRRGIF